MFHVKHRCFGRRLEQSAGMQPEHDEGNECQQDDPADNRATHVSLASFLDQTLGASALGFYPCRALVFLRQGNATGGNPFALRVDNLL